MKISCPRNAEHNKFITVAHVSQDWIVDEAGNFIKLNGPEAIETIAGPTVGNDFTCVACMNDIKASECDAVAED